MRAATSAKKPESVRGFRATTQSADHRLNRHPSRCRQRPLHRVQPQDVVPVIRREPGHSAGRLMTKQSAWIWMNAHGCQQTIRILMNVRHRPRSQLLSHHRRQPLTKVDAAKAHRTIRILIHSAPNWKRASNAKRQQYVIGMQERMQCANHQLNHRRRLRRHRHLLILYRDAVMATVFMPYSASVWMKRDRASEHRIVSGWKLMIRRNASRPLHRRPLRQPILRKDAVLDILHERFRTAMSSKRESNVNPLECVHGFQPTIPRIVF